MRLIPVCTLLLALTPGGARADSLRCGDRIVGEESVAAEVLATCGEPDYRDVCRPADITEGLGKYRLLARCGAPLTQESYGVLRPLRRRDGARMANSVTRVYREKWVYDLGPQYLQQIVSFENGRVTDVHTGARGRARSE